MNNCEYCKTVSKHIVTVPFESCGQTLFTAKLCPQCIANAKKLCKKPIEELNKIFEQSLEKIVLEK